MLVWLRCGEKSVFINSQQIAFHQLSLRRKEQQKYLKFRGSIVIVFDKLFFFCTFAKVFNLQF